MPAPRVSRCSSARVGTILERNPKGFQASPNLRCSITSLPAVTIRYSKVDLSNSGAILIPKLRRAFSQLPHLIRALRFVFEAAPGWTAAWAVLLLLQAILPVATVFLTRALVDALAAAFRSRGD